MKIPCLNVLFACALFTSAAQAATTICVATDLFSGRSFTEAGRTLNEARDAALEECRRRTGEACVVQCRDDDISGGNMPQGYYCQATDETDRLWTALGSSLNSARASALADCESEAGVNCRIQRCGFTT